MHMTAKQETVSSITTAYFASSLLILNSYQHRHSQSFIRISKQMNSRWICYCFYITGSALQIAIQYNLASALYQYCKKRYISKCHAKLKICTIFTHSCLRYTQHGCIDWIGNGDHLENGCHFEFFEWLTISFNSAYQTESSCKISCLLTDLQDSCANSPS